jgi:hypothetical protein
MDMKFYIIQKIEKTWLTYKILKGTIAQNRTIERNLLFAFAIDSSICYDEIELFLFGVKDRIYFVLMITLGKDSNICANCTRR